MNRMVTVSLLVLMLAVWSFASAEEKLGDYKAKDNPPETLFGGKDISITGYGAPLYRFSRAGEAWGSFAGGRGGFIINDQLVIGVQGVGLVYPQKRDDVSGDPYGGIRPYVGMGYGGGLIEYYLSPKKLFHVSLGAMIGGGNISFHERMNNDNDRNVSMRRDGFFIAEPEVNLFVNVARFCRIGIGVSYRYVRGIGSYELSDRDFRGPAGSVILAFGWF